MLICNICIYLSFLGGNNQGKKYSNFYYSCFIIILLHIDFALLLSYWKKRISTILQVYTAKFIIESSASKRNPQRRQDIAESALLETYHVRAAQ